MPSLYGKKSGGDAFERLLYRKKVQGWQCLALLEREELVTGTLRLQGFDAPPNTSLPTPTARQSRIEVKNLALPERVDLEIPAGPVTSRFGGRFHPVLHRQKHHNGIDIGLLYGADIPCAGDGIVAKAAFTKGNGNYLIVQHTPSIATWYLHCSRILVQAGERVKKGQAIAKVGATGLVTGPHLHFELRVNGEPVNPEDYIK
jgi:murein DD-endopeptidase MepM/ murein hydrolase activator NlpD